MHAFNAAVQTDAPFKPGALDGRSTVGLEIPKSNWALKIDEPPFEAYHVGCGITFTFGGLRIQAPTAQVVDLDLQPIPGLYAAGEMVGGIFSVNYPGGTGLTSGAVFGRLAGGLRGARSARAGGLANQRCRVRLQRSLKNTGEIRCRFYRAAARCRLSG